MVSPLAPNRNERDSLASETVPFIQLAQPGRGGRQVPAIPPFLAGTCFLTSRIDGWEVIVPLQFIPLEGI